MADRMADRDIIDLAAAREARNKRRSAKAEDRPAHFRVYVENGMVCFDCPDGSQWQCQSVQSARSIGNDFLRFSYEVERAARKAAGECPRCGAHCYCPLPRFKVHLDRGGAAACGQGGHSKKTSALEKVTCERCRKLMPRLVP